MPITVRQREYANARASGLCKKAAALSAGCPEKTASQAATTLEKSKEVIKHWARIGFNPNEHKSKAKTEAPKKEKTPSPKEAAANRLADKSSTPKDSYTDPLKFMEDLMNDTGEDPKIRLDAAKSLASFVVKKIGEKGKKDDQEDAAKQAGKKFGSTPPPPLRSVN